jgi:hypothetical protein
MMHIATLGIAGILFMLGVISIQIASLKPSSLFASVALMAVFIGCVSLAALLALAAFSRAATSL